MIFCLPTKQTKTKNMSTEPEDFRDKFDDGGLASNMSLLDHFAGQAMMVLLKESLVENKQEEIELMENRTENEYPLYSEDPSEKARDLASEAYFRAFQMIYERGYILREWKHYTELRKNMERHREERNNNVFRIRKEREKQKELRALKEEKEREASKEARKAWDIRRKTTPTP